MFMSPALTNQHRVMIENIGLPLNALNGSDQHFDSGPPSYEDAISPPLFSPMSFTSMGSSMLSSPTFPKQKSNSVSPISSPVQERQIGGRKYGVQTLADTYHVTNAEDFGLQTHHFFSDHLRPGEYQVDCPPPYEHVLQSCDMFNQTQVQHVCEELRIPECTVNTDSCSVGPGSISIINHSSAVATASDVRTPVQQKKKQRSRKKRMRHVLCGISAVVTAIAVPTLIYFITSSTHDRTEQTTIGGSIQTTLALTSSTTTAKNINRNRRHIFSIWPNCFGKKLTIESRELNTAIDEI